MCGPDIPDPKPAPKAAPKAAETAEGIESEGVGRKAQSESGGKSSNSLDRLRVNLSVPESQNASGGGFGSLLANLF